MGSGSVIAGAMIAVALLFAVAAAAPNSTSDIATGRSLSMLTLLSFPRSPCMAGNVNGTCVSAAECASIGGTRLGPCALNLGTCCTVVRTQCSQRSSFNNTYFRSSPQSIVQGTCQYTVVKANTNICQFRLFFADFVLNQVSTTGICDVDTFTVTSAGSSATNIPVICGTNTDQHMYIDSPSSSTEIQMVFRLGATPAANAAARSWNILVSQIPCGADYAAPRNCLQYFTGISGSFRTFNWLATAPIAGRLTMIANQDYTFCVRTEAGFCSICLSQCIMPPRGFNLNVANMNSLTNSVVANCQVSFLFITCGRAMNMLVANANCPQDRFCGGSLNPVTAQANTVPVCTSTRPFSFRYRTTGALTAGNVNAVGFCLNYMQNRC